MEMHVSLEYASGDYFDSSLACQQIRVKEIPSWVRIGFYFFGWGVHDSFLRERWYQHPLFVEYEVCEMLLVRLRMLPWRVRIPRRLSEPFRAGEIRLLVSPATVLTTWLMRGGCG